VVLSVLQGSGACIITLLLGRFGEFFKGTADFQEFRGCGMPCQGLEDSEVGFVYLFELALGITLDLSKPGWVVEMEVDIPVIPVEVIDASGMAQGDVCMPHVCSNHRPIFPSTGAWSLHRRERDRFAEYEAYSKPGDYMIDELRAVIGIKAENHKGSFSQAPPKGTFQNIGGLELAQG
jgi:hypothetical protein